MKKIFWAFGVVLILIIFIKINNYRDFFAKITGLSGSGNVHSFSMDVPADLNFAGEMLPLHDLESRQNFDNEIYANTYAQSKSHVFHIRAQRLFPQVEKILKRNNIPDDFKYLALIESGLSNANISPRGATGYWQFIEGTALTYGLEISDEVDERYNLEKSTEAACNYFKAAYKQLNSWTLVAASYNMGVGGIMKQMGKQDKEDYYNLTLNKETAQYIYRILAVKEIITRPEIYGYKLRKKEFWPSISTYTVSVDSAVKNFDVLAAQLNTTTENILLFNPWIKSTYLSNPGKKTYVLKIPKNGLASYDYMNETQKDSTIRNDSIKTNIESVQIDTIKKAKGRTRL